MFRRAFSTRVLKPEIVKRLGIKHIKGILLYGPPGCGKTLIARKMCECINTSIDPKIINGPEIINKYIGESEKAIRDLFAAAERDQQELGDNSPLHVIIFDEIDSICKVRGSSSGASGNVGDNIVNQLLTKIDGVTGLNNILIIGMTNRKDLIDEAILRVGRLELHLEIGLPDENGRFQIIKIHTKNLKENKNLSDDVDLVELSKLTKNYTGAEIEGFVNAARSFSLMEHINMEDMNSNKKIDGNNIIIRMAHFMKALADIKPAFGSDTNNLTKLYPNGILNYSQNFVDIHNDMLSRIDKFMKSSKKSDSKLLMLLSGVVGSGKTALAVHTALSYNFPCVRYVSPYNFIGLSETEKCFRLRKIFEDASKTQLSIIILDDLENLIEFNNYGPRFSNNILQTLLALLKYQYDHKLLVITNTSIRSKLEEMEIDQTFDIIFDIVPGIDINFISQYENHYNLTNDVIDDSNKIPIKKFFFEYI